MAREERVREEGRKRIIGRGKERELWLWEGGRKREGRRELWLRKGQRDRGNERVRGF